MSTKSVVVLTSVYKNAKSLKKYRLCEAIKHCVILILSHKNRMRHNAEKYLLQDNGRNVIVQNAPVSSYLNGICFRITGTIILHCRWQYILKA